ncbi:aminoglycoside phosphotransferase [Streptomyces albiaxialis]|uniref:Aminoglycoside phosphotransferase n=1 Tax=Streptomyces albiaxialis TaxID=329523 RepID=A0ABN2W5J2_9ACTN
MTRTPEVRRAVTAALATATSLGLSATDAHILQSSNRLTLRLLPSDTLARVTRLTPLPMGGEAAGFEPAERAAAGPEMAAPGIAGRAEVGSAPEAEAAWFEVGLAGRLAAAGCPVAAPDPRVAPRVHEYDGHAVTLWTYYAPPPAARDVPPADCAAALGRLHTGMRRLDVPAPHFTDRVEQAQRLLADRDRTPALADGDRELLAGTLRDLRRDIGTRGAPEQLLHGEPHPGNLLATEHGPLFVDLETCCRGPVEFDLAHAPEEVDAYCPYADQELLRACRALVLAMITTWRWDRHDRLPDGRRLAAEWLARLRTAR